MFNGLQHTDRRGEQYSEVCQWKRQQLRKRAIVQEFQMEFSFEGRMLEGATEDLKYGKDKKSCVDQT